MSKKYLTFLGANEYRNCTYAFHGKLTPSRFVQVALTDSLCRHWKKTDQILVFLTEEACQDNWEDSKKWKYTGLKKELSALQLPCTVNSIPIPKGKDEEALWKIFEIIRDHLRQEDEIIFDITSGFRTLPMLALIILNYARVVKKCTVAGIYYGAFDARQDDGNVPIFDLSRFVSVQDWAIGIDRFLNTGDASAIVDSTNQEIDRIRQDSRGQAENHAQNLRAISDATRAFSRNAATCREKALPHDILAIQQCLDEAIQSSEFLAKPLTPLLEHLQERFQIFSQEPHHQTANMFEVVQWCLDHNLIQQGLTLLQEIVVTDLCRKLGLDTGDYNDRSVIPRAIGAIAQESPLPGFEYTEGEYLRLDDVRKCLPTPSNDFVNAFQKLRKARNNINHASSSKSAKHFHKVLKKTLRELRKALCC